MYNLLPLRATACNYCGQAGTYSFSVFSIINSINQPTDQRLTEQKSFKYLKLRYSNLITDQSI